MHIMTSNIHTARFENFVKVASLSNMMLHPIRITDKGVVGKGGQEVAIEVSEEEGDGGNRPLFN